MVISVPRSSSATTLFILANRGEQPLGFHFNRALRVGAGAIARIDLHTMAMRSRAPKRLR